VNRDFMAQKIAPAFGLRMHMPPFKRHLDGIQLFAFSLSGTSLTVRCRFAGPRLTFGPISACRSVPAAVGSSAE
jgi:hypothetical protein